MGSTRSSPRPGRPGSPRPTLTLRSRRTGPLGHGAHSSRVPDHRRRCQSGLRVFCVRDLTDPSTFLHEDGHYDTVTSLPGFFAKSYFCGKCLKPYNNQGQHACPANRAQHCGACFQDGCPDHAEAYLHYLDPHVSCHHCHRIFYSPGCLDAHRGQTISGRPVGPDQPSVCDTRRKCHHCPRLLSGRTAIRLGLLPDKTFSMPEGMKLKTRT